MSKAADDVEYGNSNGMADDTKPAPISSEQLEAIEMTDVKSDEKYGDKTPIYPTPMLSTTLSDRWRRSAIAVSWISIILSLGFGILLFVFSVEDSSSAAFGFALTAILNSLTSAVVIWRYYGASSMYSDEKENRALIALGILFILSGISTAGKTTYSVVKRVKPDYSEDSADALIAVTITATVFMLLLGFSQLFVARKLTSCTLLTDAINSFSSSIVAMSLVISYKIGEDNAGYWYLDDITGIIIGCFLIIYGFVLLARYIQAMRRSDNYEEPS